MSTSVLTESGHWGAAIGLVILLAVFVATLVWLFRPGSKAEYDRSASLPLDDGERHRKTT